MRVRCLAPLLSLGKTARIGDRRRRVDHAVGNRLQDSCKEPSGKTSLGPQAPQSRWSSMKSTRASTAPSPSTVSGLSIRKYLLWQLANATLLFPPKESLRWRPITSAHGYRSRTKPADPSEEQLSTRTTLSELCLALAVTESRHRARNLRWLYETIPIRTLIGSPVDISAPLSRGVLCRGSSGRWAGKSSRKARM